MSVRDALLLNLTGSNFEALQSNDTARIKGDLSFEKDNETKIVEVDVSQASINVTGRVTGSSNISSSLLSTGSFGHVIATSFHGDGSAIRDTLPRSPGLLSSSAQIADVITGSFFRGFEFSSSISGSATSTGSFGRVEGVEFFGDGSNIKTTLPRSTGILTSSAQIAANISGSFTNGFNIGQSTSSIFTGVSGSTYHFSGSVSGSYFGSDYNRHLADQIGHIRSEGSSGSRDSFELVGGVIDGTWTQLAGGSLNTKRSTAQNSMTGETNAAIIAGSGPGEYDNCTETEIWNGTSWSEVNDYITGRRNTTQIGSVYASVLVGGCQTWTSKKLTEEWNGHSWAAGTDLPDISGSIIGFGTQNDAVFMSGQGQGQGSKFYNYNGTNFSTPGVAQEELVLKPGAASNGITGQSADGTSNDGIIHYTGGVPATGMFGCAQVNGSTRFWDGLTISRGPDTNTAPTGFYNRGLWGRSNSALLTRGNNTSNTEIFNGISWSEVTNFPTGPGGSNYGHTGTSADSGIKLHTVSGESNLYEWVGQYNTTASFGRLDGGVLRGDATDLHATLPYNGVVSSSAQIASNISGSFNKGFEFSGAIKAGAVVWSSVEDLITGRRGPGAQGNSATALAAGGNETNPSSTFSAKTEEWDGTSWSEVNDMNYARDGGMAGPSTNDAYFGGGLANWNAIEKWDGTSWTNISYPNSGQPSYGGEGLNPGGHRGGFMGGCASDYLFLLNSSVYAPGGSFTEYNVATETAVRCVEPPGGLHYGFSGDICTGIIAWGGFTPTEGNGCTNTTCWNGTTWSDTGARLINVPGRLGYRNHYGAGVSSTSAVHIGGETGPPAGPAWNAQCTECMHQIWDGTSWAVQGALPRPVRCMGVTGTVDDTFIVGGLESTVPYTAPYAMIVSSSREHTSDLTTGSFGRLEFISASGDATGLQSSITYVTNPAFNILTGSSQIASQISGSFTNGFDYSGFIGKNRGGVFATSTNLLDNHSSATGGSMLAGTAIIAGGSYGGGWPPVATDKTRVYDGSSWTEVNDLTAGTRGNDTLGYAGDCNAGIFFGGCSDTPNPTEEWNGTNWTEVADITDGTTSGAAGGGESSESAIWVGYFGGRGNKWDGTTWTEISNMIFARYDAQGTGTRDNFLVVGGQSPQGAPTYPGGYCAEIYNGTNWSEVADLPYKTVQAYGMGKADDAIFAGGQDFDRGSTMACNHSQVYDGTAWSFGPNINNERRTDSAGSRYSGPAAAGATNQAWLAGGSPGYPTYNSIHTEVFPGFVVSASFGRLEANKILGDASGITDTLPYPEGVVSASAQFELNSTSSYISGAFKHGFSVSGNISGSATSTGSFGKFIATEFHGADASSISGSLLRNDGVVSGSKQLSANISGSFNKGFEYEGTIQTTPGGVWSAGGALNATTTGAAGFGTKAAAIAAGTTNTGAKTEEYNGSSWSEVNDLNSGRGHFQGTGTSEAGIVYGGSSNNTYTEEWNGTNWSEVNDLIMGRSGHMKLGITSEAALAVGGSTSEPGYEDADVESWNGTNWSAGTVLPAAAAWGSSAGTYDSGIVFKWPGSETFCWNGSSWSEVADRTLARHCSAGAGSSNDALITGGQSPSTDPQINACTELYNGTSWSTGPNLISARSQLSSADGGNAGTGTTMVFGGAGTSTEHYNLNVSSASFHNIEVTSISGDGSQFSASLQTQLLTSVTQISNSISGSFTSGFDIQSDVSSSFGLHGDAWSVGGAVIDRARAVSGWGTVDAAIKAGGTDVNTSVLTANEEWNGTVWSEIADMPTKRKRGATSGVVNAGLYAGGTDGGFGGYTEASEVYIYNGLTWTETLDLPNTGDNHTGHGFTQDSALVTHGAPQLASNNADEWDGTTWTEKTANISSRGNGQGGGGTNAAHIVGGYLSSPYGQATTETECWNGSAWSQEANTNTCHYLGFYAGITNDAHVGMNWGPPNITDRSTEIYNGIAWATTAPTIYSCGDGAASGRTGVGTSQGGTHKFGGGWVYGSGPSELFNSNVSSGSFGQLRGTVGGEIKTDMFNISGSTMKLPVFSDQDLNYWDREPQQSTGSISGSVDRVGDVNLFNKPGNFFFHSDYNALAFTYVSASIYSQSIDFRRCGYQTGSVYTASSGFITQSHYCYHNVIQYITGSYT